LQQSSTEKVSVRRRFVPSLTLAYFSTFSLDFLVSLLLLDVTLTFFGSKDALHVAIVSQISTISSVASVIVGVLIAVLSVRFSRKLLLLVGALFIPIGIVGCMLAPNFLFVQIFFPFDGIGSVIVGSMAFAIAGEVLPLSRRAKAIGFIVSGANLAIFTGSIFIRYFFAAGDWRSFLLWFALPVSLFAFFFVYFGVPSMPSKQESSVGKAAYYKSFKEVFLNRSATACLVGNMTRHAGFVWGTVFSATFFRLQFGLPLATVALFALGGTLLFALGNIVGGHLVDRVGRKRLVVLCFILVGAFIAALVYVSNVWVAVAFSFASNLAGGLGAAGSLNMTVEQVPKNRGTIMSMSSVFVPFGAAIGAAVGGAVLAFSGSYQTLALTFVAFNFAAAAIYFTLTKDPCRI